MNPNISHSLRRRSFFCAIFCAMLVGLTTGIPAQTPTAPGVSQNAPQKASPTTPQNTPPIRTYRSPDPSLAQAARILAMTGQVSVLRDDVPWALAVGDTVKPQQIVVTGVDGYAELMVADGSHFEVFPNSRFIFRNNSGDWRDLLDIVIGKVKVQIEKLGGLPNPNKVRTPTAVISVRGTVFDVNVEDDDATTLVLVEEGQVEVRHLLRAGDSKVLNAGEWLRIFKNQAIAVKSNVDRGAVVQRAMRAGWDAIYQALINNPGGSGSLPGTGSTGGGTSGGVHDQCPPSNPNCKAPPAPPPPPPPPPH